MKTFKKGWITLKEAKKVSSLPPTINKATHNLRADFIQIYIADIRDNGEQFFNIETYNLLN